jgi:hypothetical protein
MVMDKTLTMDTTIIRVLTSVLEFQFHLSIMRRKSVSRSVYLPSKRIGQVPNGAREAPSHDLRGLGLGAAYLSQL